MASPVLFLPDQEGVTIPDCEPGRSYPSEPPYQWLLALRSIGRGVSRTSQRLGG